MNWFGIKRKPCGRLMGQFIFGQQSCGVLTLKRRFVMRTLVADCGQHSYKELETRKAYDREVGFRQPITENLTDLQLWSEVALSDCEYGCKIYVNDTTDERVLAHNNSYGCTKERV